VAQIWYNEELEGVIKKEVKADKRSDAIKLAGGEGEKHRHCLQAGIMANTTCKDIYVCGGNDKNWDNPKICPYQKANVRCERQ